jgi:hypothetical protein
MTHEIQKLFLLMITVYYSKQIQIKSVTADGAKFSRNQHRLLGVPFQVKWSHMGECLLLPAVMRDKMHKVLPTREADLS